MEHRLGRTASQIGARGSRNLGVEPKGNRVLDVHSGEVKIRAVPFDAIELDLGVLWLR